MSLLESQWNHQKPLQAAKEVPREVVQHWVLIEHYKGKGSHDDGNQTRSEEGTEKGRDVSLEVTFSSDIIASRIRLPKKGQLPRIILLTGACRTGTTIQFRSFGETGIVAYNNHIKAVVQGLRRGRECLFEIPSVEESGPAIFVKESIGARTPAESQLDPLKVLLRANYPSEKLAVIVTSRGPLSTWASWCEKYSGVEGGIERMTLLNNFLTAHDTAFTLYQEAKAAGIATTALVYETFRDNDPSDVMKRLFSNVSLPYSDQAVQGWTVIHDPKNLPSHIHIHLYHQDADKKDQQQDPEGTKVVSSQKAGAEPLVKQGQKHLDESSSAMLPRHIKEMMKVFATTGFEYREKSTDKITEKEVAILENAPVFGQYDQLRQATITDLEIPVSKTDEVNSYRSRQRELKS